MDSHIASYAAVWKRRQECVDLLKRVDEQIAELNLVIPVTATHRIRFLVWNPGEDDIMTNKLLFNDEDLAAVKHLSLLELRALFQDHVFAMNVKSVNLEYMARVRWEACESGVGCDFCGNEDFYPRKGWGRFHRSIKFYREELVNLDD